MAVEQSAGKASYVPQEAESKKKGNTIKTCLLEKLVTVKSDDSKF